MEQEELVEIVAKDGTVTLDPDKVYSARELDEIASQILRADVRNGNDIKNYPPILLEEHYKNRLKREIYNKEGTPDPAFGQGMYIRTHPEGRKVNSEESRKLRGSSFYR